MKKIALVLIAPFLLSCQTGAAQKNYASFSSVDKSEEETPIFSSSNNSLEESAVFISSSVGETKIIKTLKFEVGINNWEYIFYSPFDHDMPYALPSNPYVFYPYRLTQIESFDFPNGLFKDFDFSLLLPGDTFEATYLDYRLEQYNDFMYHETIPDRIYYSDEAEILSVESKQSSIIEVYFENGKIIPVEGIDFSYLQFERVISEDGSMKKFDEIEHGFALISALYGNVARAIYEYNPREV